MRDGLQVTMPEVAKAALVSEATAYRYFPDLTSLLSVALIDDWPTPAEALEPVAASNDPVERVAFATRFLLEGVATRQGAVAGRDRRHRHPTRTGERRRTGIRFGLIEHALAPFLHGLATTDPARANQLQRDLAVVVSAEALFCLTDQCGLGTHDAIDARCGPRGH